VHPKKLLILACSGLFILVILSVLLSLVGDSQTATKESPGSQGEPIVSTESTGSVTLPEADPPTAVGEAAARAIDENSGEVKGSLPLFRSVSAGYLRGAQPARGGLELLARLGVKTLVDLRSKYDRTQGVEAEAERAGLQYYWLPLSVWDPPTDAQTAEFLGVVTDQSRGPVFVFCTDGVNRTGEMTAIYRISHDGWNVDRAIKEMDEAGFSPYYYSLRNYVWSYARSHTQPSSRLKAAG
jgi:protein tyrosine phosphatase (PTP) superfamily phosphohydrolase (DUF442 family)